MLIMIRLQVRDSLMDWYTLMHCHESQKKGREDQEELEELYPYGPLKGSPPPPREAREEGDQGDQGPSRFCLSLGVARSRLEVDSVWRAISTLEIPVPMEVEIRTISVALE